LQGTRHSTPAEAEEASDRALVALASAGDATAFRVLVRRHMPRALAVARRMLADKAEAEDVAQDAMLRLWRRGGEIEIGETGLGGWLYRVTANLCLDRLRARRPETGVDLPEPASPPEQLRGLEAKALSREVDAALQRLPERQRLAIVLCHYEELSLKEAAEVIGVSAEAVESLLSRARRALRRDLEPQWASLSSESDRI
jgi:RNA polymerase sigma-70 factor (ECF subfamily)